MEWIVLPIALVAGWVLGVVGFVQARQALKEIRALRAVLAGQGVPLPVAPIPFAANPFAPTSTPEPLAPAPLALPPDLPASIPLEPPPLATARAPAPPRPKLDIEQLLTQRWGVWLGAAALLLAAVFLVRTAIEQGWLGPGPRCALALALGAVLLALAEWLRRRSGPGAGSGPGAEEDLSPSALAAGAVGAWLAGAYAAGPLYGLVPPLVSFALVAAAGLAGLALSIRFGALVAAVGLAGAFATPLLVDTGATSAAGLFIYLTLVSAAAWAVVRFTAWTWLGWAAGAGGAAWVAAFWPASGADVAAAGLFVPVAAALSVALLPGAALALPVGRRLSWAPFLLLGLAGLILTVLSGDGAARLGVLLLGPVAVAKGWTEPRLARLPYLAAALTLGVLLTWTLPAWDAVGEAISIEGAVRAVLPGPWAPAAIVPFLQTCGVVALFYAGAGAVLERRSPRPLPWAALVAAVPLLVLIAAYLQVGRFQPDVAWAAAAAVLAAGLVGMAAAARKGDQPLRRAGVHATGAVGALALGCAILLSAQWLTLAVALFLPALAWIEHRADLPPLRRVALAVAVVVLVRLVLNPWVLDYDVGDTPVLNGLLLAYGVPAACFAVAAWMLRRRADDQVVAVLEAGACAFAALLVALQVHHATNAGDLTAADPTFIEAALQISGAGALAVTLQALHRRSGRPMLGRAWRLLGALALTAGGLLIVFNPAFTGSDIGASPVVNALLPAYLIPSALALLALRGGGRPRRWLSGHAVLAAFTWVTLMVRQAFHPGVLTLDLATDDFEFWAYSVVWLALGATLMAAGLRSGQRWLRLAALALVALVVGKVFLLDMAGLDGLWRVLSFLGLGLTLIGLGAFYRRFVVPAPVPGAAS